MPMCCELTCSEGGTALSHACTAVLKLVERAPTEHACIMVAVPTCSLDVVNRKGGEMQKKMDVVKRKGKKMKKKMLYVV